MIEKCEPITHLFDAVHQLWDHRRTQRAFATLIFFIYLAGLLGIEANRQGVLPPWLEHITPISHFQAIHLAFTLILGMEVMELILTISGSLSKSLGKQFEVMPSSCSGTPLKNYPSSPSRSASRQASSRWCTSPLRGWAR